MTEALKWKDYVHNAVDESLVERCQLESETEFQIQRNLLRKINQKLAPKSIACLGAGCLNDIPVFDFINSGAEVSLVDWIPGLSNEGFKAKLVTINKESYACEVCHLSSAPETVCSAFKKTEATKDLKVCDNFIPKKFGSNSTVQCQNFKPGTNPSYVTGDVTAGRSTHFAELTPKIVEEANTPDSVLHRTIKQLKSNGFTYEELSIPSNSMDLVTSSMVISQFDREPYAFFSKNLALRFGVNELNSKEERLLPLVSKLKTTLFELQIAGHIQELYRIVKKTTGRVYISVELMRTLPNRTESFLIDETLRAMQVVNEYFSIDGETLSASELLHETEVRGGKSVIQSLVLKPKISIPK